MKGILRKLIFSHIIVIAVPLLAFGIFGLISIERAINSQFEDVWRQELSALGSMLRSGMEKGEDFKTAAENIRSAAVIPSSSALSVLDPADNACPVEALAGDNSPKYAEEDVPGGGGKGWVLALLLPVKTASGSVLGVMMLKVDARTLKAEIGAVRRNIILTLIVAALFSTYIAILFTRHFTLPLRELTAYAERVAAGKSADPPQLGTKDEIAVLGAAFGRMTEKLQERMNYIREFTQALTHELKTPLTSIIGATEILSDGAINDPEAREKFINNIDLESRHLRSIVEDVLALAKLESESVPFEVSEADWTEFVGSVVGSHRHLAENKGIELAWDSSSKAGKASFDAWRMEQVIVNMLSNAAKFTPKGGKITVSASRAGGAVALVVSDTGCGIAEEDLPHVFERFFTRPSPFADEHTPKGTGLGLAIVKGIVEAHNGTVGVESKPGSGTTFTLKFPANRE
jgi:two-component system sensor histidine kinase ChvG